MAANKLIDVSKLNEVLVIYDQALRALPFATLTEVANLLKLNVMDLQGKHARINERRRAGGTQSYKIGKNIRTGRKTLRITNPQSSSRKMLSASPKKTPRSTMITTADHRWHSGKQHYKKTSDGNQGCFTLV